MAIGGDATAAAEMWCGSWANSEAKSNASHPAPQFCRSLTINGYDGWVLPGSQEWAILWRAFKPVATAAGTYSEAGYVANPLRCRRTA